MTGLIGRINGRFGDAAWTPIRYVNRSYSRTALAGLYRAADVAMVTPLRDGMNLVAKEYVAAQDAGCPGVLILSRIRRRGARARTAPSSSIRMNPTGSPRRLKRALEMPLEERRDRYGPMPEYLLENDITKWAEDYLMALAGTTPARRLLHSLRTLLAPQEPQPQL